MFWAFVHVKRIIPNIGLTTTNSVPVEMIIASRRGRIAFLTMLINDSTLTAMSDIFLVKLPAKLF